MSQRVVSARLVLASGSPRRSALLAEYGYAFEVIVADVEEQSPPHLTPAEITLFNARVKGSAVAARCPDDWVLAADTLVAVDGEVLGKPVDRSDAVRMLELLSGRTHEVFTGVFLAGSGVLVCEVEVSEVTFRRVNRMEIERYIDLAGSMDKAGAYAAQENHLELIQRIDGSVTNVIGLPMERVNSFSQIAFARSRS